MRIKYNLVYIIALFIGIVSFIMFSIYVKYEVQQSIIYQNNLYFKQQKTNLVIDKIIERKIIEEPYYIYINDSALIESIKKYNLLTAKLITEYTRYSVELMDILFETNEKGLIYDKKEIAQNITKYALYRNATELIISDYEIAQILSNELGGSYGAWPWHIHDDGTVSLTKQEILNYFDLADRLVEELENDI